MAVVVTNVHMVEKFPRPLLTLSILKLTFNKKWSHVYLPTRRFNWTLSMETGLPEIVWKRKKRRVGDSNRLGTAGNKRLLKYLQEHEHVGYVSLKIVPIHRNHSYNCAASLPQMKLQKTWKFMEHFGNVCKDGCQDSTWKNQNVWRPDCFFFFRYEIRDMFILVSSSGTIKQAHLLKIRNISLWVLNLETGPSRVTMEAVLLTCILQ